MEAGKLIVERAVAAVGRQALDDGIDYLHTGRPARIAQTHEVRDHHIEHRRVERLLDPGPAGTDPLLGVDDEESRALGDDRGGARAER